MAREDLKELATLKMSMGELDQLAKRIAAEWAFDREQYARECEQAAYERAAKIADSPESGFGATRIAAAIRALAKETEG